MSKIKPPWQKGSKKVELKPHQLSGRIRERPFQTPEEFDTLVDEYFEYCLKTLLDNKIRSNWPTLHGLYLWLGFYDKRSVVAYLSTAAGKEYERSYRRARTLVADQYEQRLHGNTPTGAIFALKNMGWSDNMALTGPDGGPIRTVTSDMDPQDAAEAYADTLNDE